MHLFSSNTLRGLTFSGTYDMSSKALGGLETINKMRMTVNELEEILRKLDEINSNPLSNEYEREVKYKELVRSLSPEKQQLIGINPTRDAEKLTPPTMVR